MKKCSKCKQEKPVSEFHKQASKRDGLQTFCKQCKKEAYAAYYKTDKERERLRQLKETQRAKRKALIAEVKSVPCADCGITYPPHVMDFDHLRDKEFNISFEQDIALTKLKAEIAKCEVVCANCHRQRTHTRLSNGGSIADSESVDILGSIPGPSAK